MCTINTKIDGLLKAQYFIPFQFSCMTGSALRPEYLCLRLPSFPPITSLQDCFLQIPFYSACCFTSAVS